VIDPKGGGKHCRMAAVRGKLNDIERDGAVGADAAQFAVEIGLACVELGDGFGDRRILVRPVEAGACQQLHRLPRSRRACMR
jgi:hypothetical protein